MNGVAANSHTQTNGFPPGIATPHFEIPVHVEALAAVAKRIAAASGPGGASCLRWRPRIIDGEQPAQCEVAEVTSRVAGVRDRNVTESRPAAPDHSVGAASFREGVFQGRKNLTRMTAVGWKRTCTPPVKGAPRCRRRLGGLRIAPLAFLR